MKLLILLLVCISAFAEDKPTGDWDKLYNEIHGNGAYSTMDIDKATKRANYFTEDTQNLSGLADRTNAAVNGILKIAVKNLKRYGYSDLAREIQTGWRQHNGEIQEIIDRRGGYDIGDFKPLIQFLDDAYKKIYDALGYNICYILRITDLYSLNHSIPVVFDPCTYGASQFGIHMCGDPPKPEFYRGFFPIVAYWATDITCSVGLFGAGFFWLCSPLASCVEWIVNKEICPYVAPRLYTKVCGKDNSNCGVYGHEAICHVQGNQ